MSKQRDVGTRAETALVRHCHALGIPAARTALTGGDVGDVHLWHGRVVVQVKSGKQCNSPSWRVLSDWWGQTEAQADRVQACDLAVLVVKRKGTTDPGQWFAYVRFDELLWWYAQECSLLQVVCLPLGRLLAVLQEAL